jgi:chorismate-pyruvate lyase
MISALRQVNDGQLGSIASINRILLVTDGTVTNIIEAYVREPVHLAPLGQRELDSTRNLPLLEPSDGESVMERAILLRGKNSGTNYLYAESHIALDRLDSDFREELLAAQLPIGRIWTKLRLETYKEIVDMGRRPARSLCGHFKTSAESPLLFRTYRVFSRNRPIMVITETFPEHWPAMPPEWTSA